MLVAAIESFASQGYARSSLAEIAVAAGVTRGAVYHHYQDKQRLFLAVAARLQEQVIQAAEAAGDDPKDQLVAGSHAFLDAMTDPARVRVPSGRTSCGGLAKMRDLDAANSVVRLHDGLAEVGMAMLEPTTALLSGAMNEDALWIAQQSNEEVAREQAHAALRVVLGCLLDAVKL